MKKNLKMEGEKKYFAFIKLPVPNFPEIIEQNNVSIYLKYFLEKSTFKIF